MSEFEFDADDFISKMTSMEDKIKKTVADALGDSTDDLARIASEIAPIKGSGLRKSVTKDVKQGLNGVTGEVTFSVIEKSGDKAFNYALWTHEQDYNLGEQSSASPGTDGYHVGNKYLERPLKGESERFINDWAKAIARGLLI